MNIKSRAQVLAALGDPLRLEIADALTLGDLAPDALVDRLGITSSLLAHHLNVLEDAGLLSRTKSHGDRRRTYLHLNSQLLPHVMPSSELGRPTQVIFVCTHNSARSILAEAMFREVSSLPCASAGTHPAESIHPRTRKVAARKGLRIEKNVPSALSRRVGSRDLVVSVCDAVREEVDALPHSSIHWSIVDPAEKNTDEAFVAAAEIIEDRVANLARHIG